MRYVTNRSIGVSILIGVVVLGAVALGPWASGTTAGTCATVAEGSIDEPTAYVPYSDALRLVEVPILVGGAAAADEPASASAQAIDGRPRQLTLDLGHGGSVTYYSDAAIAEDTLPSQFLRAGGMQLERYLIDGSVFHEDLLALSPKRVVAVEIGPYQGAMTWADPDAAGMRTHNVYWSDGQFNLSLVGDRSAAVMITLARGLACNGST